MREDTIKTKVYPFDELSDESKEKVIENLYNINVDFEWWNFVFDEAKTIGFEITEFGLDRNSCCRGKWTEDAKDVARLILENHGETCETYKDAFRFMADFKATMAAFEASSDYDSDEDFDESDEYEELCKEFQRTICEDYRIRLQKEYEYLTSEDAIIEMIKANDYEFTVNGTIY